MGLSMAQNTEYIIFAEAEKLLGMNLQKKFLNSATNGLPGKAAATFLANVIPLPTQTKSISFL